MTKMMKDSIGIDISKDHLDVHRPGTGAFARHTSDPAGFRALKRWIGDRQPHPLVHEATGPHHGRFEQAFAGNPPRARRLARACGRRARTDRMDARMLARMGPAPGLVADRPADEGQDELKESRVARTALVKDRTRLRNRLKTRTLAMTRRHTRARLAQVERRIDALQGETASRLKASPKRARAYAVPRSIRGTGDVVAAAIPIECPGIGTLGKKQVAALAGLAPMTRQSGEWKGRAFIQGGRKYLRHALCMPALVAIRFNPDLKQKYQSMIKTGKPPEVALTAIMRKLIELANALIKADRMWKTKMA